MIELPFIADWAVRPGEVLELIMEDDGLTIQQVADSMDVSDSVVEHLISSEEAIVDPPLADKLEVATGFPSQCWINLENQYRIDAARLVSKRIGLFDNLDSFVQAEGKSAEFFKRAAIGSLKLHGDNDRVRMAEILANVKEYVIMMEIRDDNLHVEIRFGRFGEAYVIMGPTVAKHVMSMTPKRTERKPKTKPVDLTPAIMEAETTYAFVSV